MKKGLMLGLLTVAGTLHASSLENEVHLRMERMPDHPRILLTDTAFATLQQNAKTDTVLQRYIGDVLKRADRGLSTPTRTFGTPDGLRFGGPQHIGSVPDLAFAYRWTGDKKYKDKAVTAMTEVSAFPNWNPRHFLCCAGMMTNVALGYDWLYRDLSDSERATFSSAILRLGLGPNSDNPTNRTNNWGGVCNAGITMGALAIANDSPEIAEKMIVRSVKRFPRSMAQYAPAGAWYEGAGYWSYMSEITFRGIEALRVALDTDFNLMALPGVDKTAWFPIIASGPTGAAAQFADVGDARINQQKGNKFRLPRFSPVMFLLGRIFNEPAWIEQRHRGLTQGSASIEDLIFYQKQQSVQPDFPKAVFFDGTVQTFFARSAWNDPNAAWLCVKAGENNVPHGQLDAGNFEYEVDGVRWAYDLGKDDYNMPGYFGSKRWSYYRNISESHNVLLINGKGQPVKGRAAVIDSSPEHQAVLLEMKTAYADPSLNLYRRMLHLEGRALDIQDVLEFSADASIQWGMTTDADIAIQPDGSAILTRNGKTLKATILQPKGLTFSVGSCHRKPPENPNEGYRRLTVEAKVKKDIDFSLFIRLEPKE